MSAPTPGHDMPAMPISPFIPPPDRPRRAEPSRLRRIPLAPAEGWLTILLIVLLVLPIAWSISDARYVLGRGDLTAFLPLAALLGVSWGMLGAKVGWGRWRTHLLGAVIAALVVPILVGTTLVTGSADIGAMFKATAASTVDAVLDLSIRQRSVTQQYGHYLLVLGLIVWGTAQFAGYATLGHRRPLGAVFVTGLVLLTNMAITQNDQLSLLVLFSLAALLLLVRLHADEERLSWLHRRIGDPAAVTGLYLRGGAAFVAIAVVGALVLTTTAASAPLAAAFSGLDDQLVSVGQQFERFLPVGGPGTRISGVSFGPNALITGQWNNDPTEAIEIDVPPGDTTSYYWRAYTYDKFTQNAWSISDDVRVDRDANLPILDGTGDAIQSPDLRRQLTFTVTNKDFPGATVFAPDAPATVSIDTKLSVIGSDRYFGGLEADGWKSYTATALVPVITKSGSTGWTENELRVAGNDYPQAVRELYLAPGPTGTLGPESKKLLARIVAAAGPTQDAYDVALAADRILQNSNEFHYDTNVKDLADGPCKDLSVVECFATYKRGYCQYYATTMALLLRADGIPTRFVQGWLPGTRDPKTGVEPILRSNSHAWVEVYFPGYGWYPFDPTAPGGIQPAQLPLGPIVSPKPSATARPRSSGDTGADRTIRPAAGAGTTTTQRPGGPSPAGLIVVATLLLIAVGGIAFLAYRRGPRGPTHPEAAWRGVVGLASRFGWAPRPNQTPFEYAGALSEVIPVARPDLYTVATARVEVVYGRHSLDADRLARVRLAQRRLRVTLLRLIVRRPARPRIRLR
ncbi:MAG: DUF4129 domain-containing transglutaminase family protein [Candidatus Limnocylindrales bacterium]